MFRRTYRPLVDSERQRFAGFESKVVDFESGCAVARVGAITEGGGPDPAFYDIFAVEQGSKRFLFKVDAWAERIGEINGRAMVSAAAYFCDRDPVHNSAAHVSSSFKPAKLNPRYTTHYDFQDPDEFRRVTAFLKEGVRRLSFSCDNRFSASPVEYYAEFRFRNPPVASQSEWQPDLASLLTMRALIDDTHGLARIGYKFKDTAVANHMARLMAKEEHIDGLIESNRQDLAQEAHAWIDENDVQASPTSVLAALNNPSNEARLMDLEWVLAQLVSLEPRASDDSSQPMAPGNLEIVVSEPSVQEILRSIYADQFEGRIASFGTFLSQILLVLTVPYIVRLDQIAATRVKNAVAKERESQKKAEEIRADRGAQEEPSKNEHDGNQGEETSARSRQKRRYRLWPF